MEGIPQGDVVVQDFQGDTALHLAARYNHAAVVELLLAAISGNAGSAGSTATKNKLGYTPLHVAAYHNAAAAARLLLAANPAALQTADRKRLLPYELARRRGHAVLASTLQSAASDVSAAMALIPLLPASLKPTLVVAPPECRLHRTYPEPATRGVIHPPPENVDRLDVLVAEGRGILHATEFASALQWEQHVSPAPLSDVLRVHDWTYVKSLQQRCQAIPDRADIIGRLDPDTSISHHSFRAALIAVGAVCLAVDRVISGAARNAFCAVRPPGHHAGPRGVVPSAKDPTGSHGFCLLNNVAIAAGYAMNVHRYAMCWLHLQSTP